MFGSCFHEHCSVEAPSYMLSTAVTFGGTRRSFVQKQLLEIEGRMQIPVDHQSTHRAEILPLLQVNLSDRPQFEQRWVEG